MVNYPLLFDYKDLIAGKGFLAGVATAGRALLREDEEGFWMHGVQPGGICADGDSQKEAAAEFRAMYRAVLFDIAAEAPDFECFHDEVRKFFEDEDQVLAEAWNGAVDEVRRGGLASDWLNKQPAESPRSIEVVQIALGDDGKTSLPAKKPEPNFNALDGLARAA